MAARAIPKMKLWYYPMARSVRCAWLIKELGLDDKVEYKFVDIMTLPPSPEREEYRKNVHLHSTVPALEIEGRSPILDSTSICMYLADLCENLLPKSKDRAEYYDWMLYSSSRMDEPLNVLYEQYAMIPKEQQNAQAIAKALVLYEKCLDRVEDTLKDRQFLLGDEITAADCAVGYHMICADLPEMKEANLLNGRPNIRAYVKRVKARQALQEALALS